MHLASIRIAVLGGFAAVVTGVAACSRGSSHGASSGVLPAAPPATLALRIVDSSRAGEALFAVRLRLIGPVPAQDTIACSDSTRQAVLWIASLKPGRYQLVLSRAGYERRLVLVDVAPHQADTVTVGLRAGGRDVDGRNAGLAACGHR
jgi:hypothetical protein